MRKPTEAEARELLRRAAGFLSTVPNASISLKFAATAITEYLAGKHASLDHAFGLITDVGHPKTDLSQGGHFDAAYKAFTMKMNDKSWGQICNKLNINDKREFRRICKRYHDFVIDRYCRDKFMGLEEGG